MALSGQSANHYHANNVISEDNRFVDAISEKDKKITLCGVIAHHQNFIIENKKKNLTAGARTLLLHGIRMWIQIIDEIFSPLTIKAMAERMNIFQIDLKGRTLESILHGVEVRDIPMKYYHTLFCPIYDIDTHLQSAGGSCAGPTRW